MAVYNHHKYQSANGVDYFVAKYGSMSEPKDKDKVKHKDLQCIGRLVRNIK